MDKVQVHPTGLLDPKDPGAKVKFLAAEALRGVGGTFCLTQIGLLLDANGNRFADELGHRDYVTGQMWKNKGPFRLVLNGKGGKEILWHCKHYMGRGLMKYYKNAQEMAKDTGISLFYGKACLWIMLSRRLVNTMILLKTKTILVSFLFKQNPVGKKFFANLPFVPDDEFWVAIVTPVLHFTMGGVQIDDASNVIGAKGVIPGLFACGEVAGMNSIYE